MDWSILEKKVNDITKEDENDPLYDYEYIDRYNLDKLQIGMHIKYIKKTLDLETGKVHQVVYNGGFLVNILNGDKIVNMVLILKSNIIWKLRFIKYQVYGKPINKLKKTRIKDDFREIYKDEINLRKKELNDKLNNELDIINKSKDKYKVIF